MAPKKGKKKTTKSERKRSLIERGKKGAEARGKGVGSRQDEVLPAKWRLETKEYASGETLKVISPNKTVYHGMAKAKAALEARGLHSGVHNESSDESSNSDSEYWPSPTKVQKLNSKLQSQAASEKHAVVERQFFVAETSQLTNLLDQVNRTSRCGTPDCNGILVPAKVETIGLGGTVNVVYVCNGCLNRKISFEGSLAVEGSRRTVVGLALAVAFIVTGHGFAKFQQTLNNCLGIAAISKNRFYEVIQLIYPHIQDIVDEMCEDAKEAMKALDSETLGSWDRAVVTSDGVWHTRGHFSKNGTFIIKNYFTQGLLWYGHKSMRGQTDEEEGDELYLELYLAKSMEGELAEELYGQAIEEGCNLRCPTRFQRSSTVGRG